MPKHISLETARTQLRTRARLIENGWQQRDIERAVASGEIRRLQPNRYVKGALWSDLWPESRHLLDVAAAHAEMRGGGAAFSYESAGVLHGVPLYRHVPRSIHVTLPQGARASSRSGLMRHRDALPDADVCVVDGIRCTTLERTTFDAVRVLSREASVAFADAALRAVTVSPNAYDLAAADEWKGRMLERVAQSKGIRGVRQAEQVIRFADGRAQLPGESVSRLQLARLGFSRFELQVPVPGPHGREYRVDIGLEEVPAFFEFDGEGKYLDEALRSGRSIEEVLLDEKRREDWIRGTTRRHLIRAEDAHIVTSEALAARLGAFGFSLPRH
jgi:hypothetical protein